MRIYIPLTPQMLREDLLPTHDMYAVTQGLVDVADPSFGEDEHEELARGLAARTSLHMCVRQWLQGVDDVALPLRRIVASADIDGELPERNMGQVSMDKPLGWDRVVSIHIDDDDAATEFGQMIVDDPPADSSDDAINEWLATRYDLFDMDWYDISELHDVRDICLADDAQR